MAHALKWCRDMNTSTLNRLVAAFVIVVSASASAAAATRLVGTPSGLQASDQVSPTAQTLSTPGEQRLEAKRAKLPRSWVWQKKAIKFDDMYAR